MNKETMQEAERLSAEINDAQSNIRELEDLEGYVKRAGGGDQPFLTTSGTGRRVFIPHNTALYWLSQEKPRLETKLNDLKKEFKDL